MDFPIASTSAKSNTRLGELVKNWVCVGFLQAERKDDRIGKKEETPKRAEGEKQMLAECESRWTKLAQEETHGA